jgi:hypothetical protein
VDLVLAADVLYTRANVEAASRLLPRLLAPGGEIHLADPGRAGARDFLAAARGTFWIHTERAEDVSLQPAAAAAAPLSREGDEPARRRRGDRRATPRAARGRASPRSG